MADIDPEFADMLDKQDQTIKKDGSGNVLYIECTFRNQTYRQTFTTVDSTTQTISGWQQHNG